MTTDAQAATPDGQDDRLLLDRVARCCEPAAWARSRGWLAHVACLAGATAGRDASPEDWGAWLLNARPSVRAEAQRLLRSMAHQVWRLEPAVAQGAAGASVPLRAAIRVGGQRWHVALVATPRMHVVALSQAREGVA